MNSRGRWQSLLPLPDVSRKIEEDSARRVVITLYIKKLQNTGLLICTPLNKNSINCMPRSTKRHDTCKCRKWGGPK